MIPWLVGLWYLFVPQQGDPQHVPERDMRYPPDSYTSQVFI